MYMYAIIETIDVYVRRIDYPVPFSANLAISLSFAKIELEMGCQPPRDKRFHKQGRG